MATKFSVLVKACFISVFVLVFNALSGCSLLPREEEALAPPLMEPEQINYKTDVVKRGYIEKSIEGTGYFVPAKTERHFFRHRAGKIKKIHVGYGDMVKEGDLIAELITDSLEDEIRYQRIDVDLKTKALDLYKKTSSIDLEMAKEELSKLENRYASMKESPELYSPEQLKSAENEANAAKLNLQKLELNIQYQVDLKTNELEIARHKLASLEKELEQSRLYATIEGQVTYTANLNEGDFIDTYVTVVIVSDLRDLLLEYNGRDASSYKIGMQVEITVDKKQYAGEVVMNASTVPYEEYEKYRDTVRFTINPVPEGVKRGDSARIKLVLETSENTLIIPRNALRLYMGRNIVYVLEDGIRVEKFVEKGIEQGNLVEIREGLSEGELVIID